LVPPVPGRRVADLSDFGFIEFIADEIPAGNWSR
jgi:hypothetical protein